MIPQRQGDLKTRGVQDGPDLRQGQLRLAEKEDLLEEEQASCP